jgi:hypothetical protein
MKRHGSPSDLESEAGFGIGQPLQMVKAASKNNKFLNNSFMPE